MDDARDLFPANVGWSIVGLVVFALIAIVVYALVGAIVLGLFLYYATRPVYRWLDARLDHSDVNAAVTLMLVGVPILVVLAYAELVGVQELDRLLGRAGRERLRTALRPYVDVARLSDPKTLPSRLDERVPQILGLVDAVLSWFLRVFVAFTVAFYLLRDDRAIARWARRSFHGDTTSSRSSKASTTNSRRSTPGNS